MSTLGKVTPVAYLGLTRDFVFFVGFLFSFPYLFHKGSECVRVLQGSVSPLSFESAMYSLLTGGLSGVSWRALGVPCFMYVGYFALIYALHFDSRQTKRVILVMLQVRGVCVCVCVVR